MEKDDAEVTTVDEERADAEVKIVHGEKHHSNVQHETLEGARCLCFLVPALIPLSPATSSMCFCSSERTQ